MNLNVYRKGRHTHIFNLFPFQQKSTSHEHCNLNQPDTNCSDLDAECIDCNFNETCIYGSNVTVLCQKKPEVVCKGTAGVS